MSANWYKTRSGLPAVVFATDHDKERPFIGAYMTDNQWFPTTWRANGMWHPEPGHPRGIDLMMDDDAPLVS